MLILSLPSLASLGREPPSAALGHLSRLHCCHLKSLLLRLLDRYLHLLLVRSLLRLLCLLLLLLNREKKTIISVPAQYNTLF